MKLKLFILTFILCVSSARSSAKGIIPIVYSAGETIAKVSDLPHRDEFTIQASDGRYYHADLGIMHDQFSLFWIPIFNYGAEKYVLYTDSKVGEYDYTYVELSRDDITYLQSQFGGIPSVPELPLWDAWGGILLIILLLVVVCRTYLTRSSED